MSKRTDIVKNPKGTAVGGGDQVVLLHGEVVNGNDRHVQAQRMPVVPTVKRNIHSFFCSGIEQTFSYRVFPHGAHKIDVANAIHGFLPGLTKIPRPENVRTEIVQTIAIDRGVGSAGIKVRRFENADRAPDGDVRRRNILPRRASIFRHLNISVVASNPNQSVLNGRRRDRENRAGNLLWVFGIDLRATKIRADGLPSGAGIRGLQQKLRAQVEQVRILRRENHGNGPVEMIFAAEGDGRGRNIAYLSSRLREANDAAAGARVVNRVRIDWIGNGVAAFAGADRRPLTLGDLAVVATAGDSSGAAILLRAVNPVRKTVIGGYSIKFSRRLVVPGAPSIATVHGDDGALIDAEHDALGVGGVDPDGVIVVATGSPFYYCESAPSVGGAVQRLHWHIDYVWIVGVGENLAHVRVAFDAVVLGCAGPRSARVVGAIEATRFFFRLND